ncbi:hypothetical protein [Terrimonas sp.]|uniref:hypothetical protein n=1 Tax=Terrimonas sp. TaxID=1914338 RepID=UPI0019825621|nr:hypothetical protein [Terrimonas sp.]
MIRNATTEDMKSLTLCLNKLLSEGFEEDFKATDEGLQSLKTNKTYTPEQIQVVNFYRFEGASDPADNSILYAVETTDGAKGTLVDAFGPYADEKVDKFMKDVEEIYKKNTATEKAELL